MFQVAITARDGASSTDNPSCEASTQVVSNLTHEASTQTSNDNEQPENRYITNPIKSEGVVKHAYSVMFLFNMMSVFPVCGTHSAEVTRKISTLHLQVTGLSWVTFQKLAVFKHLASETIF